MDLSRVDPEQVLVGHIGGQLVLATDAEDERKADRLLRGYMMACGDMRELAGWLAREDATCHDLLGESHLIPDAEQVVAHVGGQLVVAADAEDQQEFDRLLRGYMLGGGDGRELILWLAREVGASYARLGAADPQPGRSWQHTLRLRLLDVEAELERLVAEAEATHRRLYGEDGEDG